MKLLVKKLTENAFLPTKDRDTDEGFDIYASEPTRIFKGSVAKVSTGIAAMVEPIYKITHWPDGTEKEREIFKSFWLQIEGRSGMASKGVYPVGGIVDNGYTGEICVILVNNGDSDHFIQKGDKIAQLVIREHQDGVVEEIYEFPETDRGAKGFGSSGN